MHPFFELWPAVAVAMQMQDRLVRLAPQLLDGIEPRCIGGQVDQGDPFLTSRFVNIGVIVYVVPVVKNGVELLDVRMNSAQFSQKREMTWPVTTLRAPMTR